jgi:peptidoglycan DL-endopeptidase CwlO
MSYYRYRYSRRMTPRQAGAAVAAGLALAMAASAGSASAASHHHQAAATTATETHAARVAIAYARHQLGCPYVYGGTGPCSAGFDCSGLMMMAYRAAGIGIPRTSEGQWAHLPHVRRLEPGDLVLAVGSPVDPPPGHVGLYLGDGLVEQAYATGYPIDIVSLGTFGAAAGGIVGFAEVN